MDQNFNNQIMPIKKDHKMIFGALLVLFVGLFLVKDLFLSKNDNAISINGYAKIAAKPTSARLIVGWYGSDVTLAEASNKEREIFNNIMKELARIGLAYSDLTISYPKSSYGTNGFQVVNAMTINLKDLSKLNDLTASLYKVGVLTIETPIFTTSDPQKFEKDAVTAAINDARLRAQDAAKAARKSLGAVKSVVVSNQQEAGITNSANVNPTTNAIDNIELAKLVTVTFELK